MLKQAEFPLSIVGLVGLVFFAVPLIATNIDAPENTVFAAGSLNRLALKGIGVEIEQYWNKNELTYEIEKVNNAGSVVWVKTNSENTISNCYLGAYYLIDKKIVSGLQSSNLEIMDTLKRAIDGNNYLSPRAKEFPKSFLIFEPNRKPCAGNIFSQKRELGLRQLLWQSVSGASLI